MAKIIQKDNGLNEKYKEYKNTSYICYGTGIFCFALSLIFISELKMSSFAIISLGMAAMMVCGKILQQKASGLKSGVEGENITAQLISTLPEGYYAFQNLTVTYDGKPSEIDMVVVGKSGVFIVETKNHSGLITGYYDNPQWAQNKIGKGGTPYTNSFYNPVKQVGTHVYRLANYLRQKGIDVHVNALVYFANPGTSLDINDMQPQIPIFCASSNGASEILGHIMNTNKELSNETVVAICNTLYNI